jgi:hypothetical protein
LGGKVALHEILTATHRAGLNSFLSVLKLFGKGNDKSPLSFPIEGYTLSLDFKINDRTLRLLNELDKIVIAYQGRVYLAKDVRMSAEFFNKTYPGKAEFERTIAAECGKFQSLQSKRIGLGKEE